jgi:type II secretory pathway pseudopilin PulG
MKKASFTLIEIAAVLMIIGLLTGTALLCLAHIADERGFETTCQELAQADLLARSAARQSGQLEHLIYDLDEGEVLWQSLSDAKPAMLMKLNNGDTIQLRTSDRLISSGQLTIDCSPSGYSQSYALCLSRSGLQRWMITAGLSGRIFWTNDDKQVDAVFQSLAVKGLQAGSVEAAPSDDSH